MLLSYLYPEFKTEVFMAFCNASVDRRISMQQAKPPIAQGLRAELQSSRNNVRRLK